MGCFFVFTQMSQISAEESKLDENKGWSVCQQQTSTPFTTIAKTTHFN
ncbi:hypothetical protein D929_02213 [Enterococcus faecalis 02-MB-P-10]|nr:hypothetical protein D929_02213 [Enterococcus faecalis 02-MB-P-10]